jgi:hypothetical protein
MERRKGTRSQVNFEVLVSTHSKDSLILQASDISDVGIYLLSEGEPPPPLGSVIQVKLNANIGTQNEDYPIIDMIIKRIDSTGIGLQYLKPQPTI